MLKKLTLFFSLVIFSTQVSWSQFPSNWSRTWQLTTLSNYSQEGRLLALDPSGNAFVIVDATSNIGPNGHPSNSTQYYVSVLKYDPNGVLLLTRNISVRGHIVNGFSSVNSFGLQVDNAGNVYIGYLRNEGPVFKNDVYITKLNGNTLNTIWSYRYESSADERGIQLKLAGSAVYALFYSDGGTSTTGSGYGIIKASAAGSSTTAFYKFHPADIINGIDIDNSFNLYVTGSRSNPGTSIGRPISMRINPAGVRLWERDIVDSSVMGNSYGKRIHIVGNNAYIVGTAENHGTNGNDVMIAKYNINTGIQLWVSYLHRNLSDEGQFVISAAGGNDVHVIFNTINAVVVAQINPANGKNIERMVYTPTPVSPFTSQIGVSVNDVKIASSGNVYVMGTGRFFLNPNKKYEAGFLIKAIYNNGHYLTPHVLPVSGSETQNSDFQSFALDASKTSLMVLSNDYAPYKTHVNESISVRNYEIINPLRTADFPSAEDVKVWFNSSSRHIVIEAITQVRKTTVFDLSGRQVFESDQIAEYLTMDATWLPAGIYLVRTLTENGIRTRKISIN